MNWEYERTAGWGGIGYSLYAVQAMTVAAEVARHREVDLYDYTSDGTRGLRVAMDYLAPFLLDPGHLEVLNRWGRPLTMNIWALGSVTLTHAKRFDLGL